MIVSRGVPQFGLPTEAYFDYGSVQAQLMATGARIAGFMLYLALSYGMVYFLLGTKRSLGGWNNKEQLISPAIMGAIILIIAIGTMLVGPFPALLLAVSLVGFAGYVRSSEALASLGVTVSDRASFARMLSSVIGTIGSLMRELAMGLAHHGLGYARHPLFVAARRALAASVARLARAEVRTAATLSESLPEDTARPLADQSEESEAVNMVSVLSSRCDDHNCAPEAATDQGQPPHPGSAEGTPPLSSAEAHGLDAVQAALAPPKQARPLTRDQAKRLLDCLEGR
jgi:hypothetical protein